MSKALLVAEGLSRPVAEYAHAGGSGPLLLIGAKGATRADGPVPLGESFADATEQQVDLMMANVDYCLQQFDARAGETVHATVFMTDWRFQPGVAAGLERYFGAAAPAMTYVDSPAFALPELLFEIDLAVRPGGEIQYLTADGGGTLATWCDGWLYSAGLAARRDESSWKGELADISGQIDAILGECGLSRKHVLRVRLTVTDARDVEPISQWWDAGRGPRPAAIVSVAPPARPGRRVTADFIACSEAPVRVSAREAGWTGENPLATVATYAKGVAFTAASPGEVLAGELGVAGIAERLEAAIEPLGLTADDVLKVEGLLDDWRLYGGFRREYTQAMSDPYPTRSLTQGVPWKAGAHTQLSWIAVKGAHSATTLLVPPQMQTTNAEVS
jgi:enamine deaminase RidA (YjgF/YER057c/UK114 family)